MTVAHAEACEPGPLVVLAHRRGRGVDQKTFGAEAIEERVEHCAQRGRLLVAPYPMDDQQATIGLRC